MSRIAALLWLAVVLTLGGHLAWRLHDGLNFRTDLMALLPREEQDPLLQKANDQVTEALSRQLLLLIGAPDRAVARAAAADATARLNASGLVRVDSANFDSDRLRRMGELYHPYRRGLLSEEDRRRLQAGDSAYVASRALSQVYGFVGMGNAALLQSDPFLLLPAFFASLPLSRMSLDDGMLTLQSEGKTWILVSGRMAAPPYAIDTQTRMADLLDPWIAAQRAASADLEILRLGAVFFAKAGAEQALRESSLIGAASLIGTMLLILLAFRSAGPLWLNFVAVASGIVSALSASLLLFGELHVSALLFGVSLIGIAVDYGLQYCTEVFAPGEAAPHARLRRVFAGITLGVASVIVGYLTLFLAPFPGLHQIAAFSAIGLFASWLSVVLWLPKLDRMRPPRHRERLLVTMNRGWHFWRAPNCRIWRRGLAAVLLAVAAAGLFRLHADDDVRRMQSLSSTLVAEQQRIQGLIGAAGGTQFFLVQGRDSETALQREEALISRLRGLVADGALAGFQAPALFVPSAARQMENRELQRSALDGEALTQYLSQIGLARAPQMTDDGAPPLTLDKVLASDGPLKFLELLLLDDSPGSATHVVTLDGVARPGVVADAASALPGVRFVDPASDFSALLGKYRGRAILLLGASLLLMMPLLIWRYGTRGAAWVILPSLLAVVLTPLLRAAAGGSFTFFDAMALVLVLSVGIDYGVFIAETTPNRQSVTLLAVILAACTTLLSFGLLSLSGVLAVHNFGLTMLIGVLLAAALSPLAHAATRHRTE